MVRIERAYESAKREDGKRVLVDRVWPRGVSRERLHLDEWMKEIAPSTNLRKWFAHKVERWEEFRRRYQEELKEPERAECLEKLASLAGKGTVTLLFSARDEEHNQAVVLAGVLAEQYGCTRHD